MRTTLTLDEDVAKKLKAAVRRTGRSFRDIVNEALRHGLISRPSASPVGPFRIAARDLGNLRPGLQLDSIPKLLDEAEGPLHR